MSEAKHSPFPEARTLAAEHERLGRAAVEIVGDYARSLDTAPVCSTATPAELEALVDEPRVLRWLCQLVGYGEASFGTLTSGGSEANLIGLKCARDRAAAGARDRGLRSCGAAGDLIVYASEQCHYSFVKGVDILGLGRENLRKVDTDERFHIRTDLLRQTIERDIAEGRTPTCIAGAAGATSTGIVDPL